MAKTETGWTDEYPQKSDAGDEYYFVRRKDRADVVIMGFSMGKAWLNGVSYEPSELRSHLFLGPLRPSDFEQLTRLREAVPDAIKEIEKMKSELRADSRYDAHHSARVFTLDTLAQRLKALAHRRTGE